MGDRDEGLRTSRLIGGGLLLLVGAVLLLGRSGVVPETSLGDFWPLLLVWVGATRMFGPSRGRFPSGGVVLALGIFFLLDRFGWIDVPLGDLWPLFLVAAGIALMLEAGRSERPQTAAGPAPEKGGRS